MSKSFKKVSDIISELPALSTYLLNAGNYYAHLSNFGNLSKETLEEHTVLVNRYLGKLVQVNQLDSIIDELIDGLDENVDSITGSYIKELFVYAITFHDYGKINEQFQFAKMQNSIFKGDQKFKNPIGSGHSSLSAFIYLVKNLNEIILNKEQNPLLIVCCLYFSYSILKHHGSSLDDDSISIITFSDLRARHHWEEVIIFLSEYLDKFQYEVNPNIINLIGNDKLFMYPQFASCLNSFEFYALCRLNFSLLTASDYLATNDYMNSLPIEDFGILTNERISELYNNISKREWLDLGERKNYNKDTYASLENYVFLNPKEKCGRNLNVLRKEMGIEIINNIRKYQKKYLFYIEAPTGGGKTNLSILAIVELLKIFKGEYNKVFYVLPFTTLITQTYTVIQEMLGLREEEIIELHSRAGMKLDEDDGKYGNEKLNYINYLFVNYPFSVLSHVKFFDILKSNDKEVNYLLHRLANSIIVIDELQSYNPIHWDKIIYFIRQYADKFNIKFILMSATLPKLDYLNVLKNNKEGFVYLLPKAKELYFNNINFSRRVIFDFELLRIVNFSLDELANKVFESSVKYLKYDFGHVKPRNSVYVIVEFIYKQAATDFYNLIRKYNFFDEILVLSGTIIEHRKKEIINSLKNPDNRRKKIILITTQVVEAGVDIDMDLGFKDQSIIDSDEQLAGRINRNVNKEHCVLYLFNYNKESVIYGKDLRYKMTRDQIGIDEYRRILEEKDFDSLYNKIFEDRNRWNDLEMVQNFGEYESAIHQLKFKRVNDEFSLIEQKNISCFIPIEVPIYVKGITEGEFEEIFTVSELSFLFQNGIYPNNEKISGEEVFNLYVNSIHNKIEFTQQQIRKKVLQSIMSKYTFSIFGSISIENNLIHFLDIEKSVYGYFYIQRWCDVYTIEKGLDAKKLGGIEETQFL